MAQLRNRSEHLAAAEDIKQTAKVSSTVIGVICAIALMFTALIIIAVSDGKNTAHDQRVSLEQLLSDKAQSPGERRQIALAILDLDTADITSIAEDASYGSAAGNNEVETALKVTAATGEPLRIDTSQPSTLIWQPIAIVLAIALSLYSLICLAIYGFRKCYSSVSSEDSNFIVDINFRQVGIVLIMASWVLAWPVYLVSAVRLRKAKQDKFKAETHFAKNTQTDRAFHVSEG